jgi:hypothetical protein
MAEFTEYIRGKDFGEDRLGIKAFKNMGHPENIMALFQNKDMKKIIKFLSHKRNDK